MSPGISENLTAVQKRIDAAAERSSRSSEEIRLVAVSKTHPVPVLRASIEAGIIAFGENKVQEAEGKVTEIGRDTVQWHLIGHLQSNKARKALRLFDVIQSVDSTDLAQRLERTCEEEGRESLSVLVQVDLAGEGSKSGIPEADLPELVEYLGRCRRLAFDGFMIVPPFFDEPEAARPFFRRLRELRDRYRPGGELSMGMSHDFEVAIEEGATIVRVGTAIFGQREYGVGR